MKLHRWIIGVFVVALGLGIISRNTEAVTALYNSTVRIVDSVSNIVDGVASATTASYNSTVRVVDSSGNVLDSLGSPSPGTNSAVQPKTFTSSAITTTGVLGFTSSGTNYCAEILAETGATGLATGTNFTITTTSTFGPLVIASEPVASLGANLAVVMSAASVTPLVPFVLTNGQTLTLKCTGVSCDGAGTIRLTPVCMRLTESATLN